MKMKKLALPFVALMMLLVSNSSLASFFEALSKIADISSDPFSGHWIYLDEKKKRSMVIEFSDEGKAVLHKLDRRKPSKRNATFTIANDNEVAIDDGSGDKFNFRYQPDSNTGVLVADGADLSHIVLKRGYNHTQDEIDGTWVQLTEMGKTINSLVFQYEGDHYYSSHVVIDHSDGTVEVDQHSGPYNFTVKDGIEFTEVFDDGSEYTFFVMESDGETRTIVDNEGAVWKEFKSDSYEHPEIPDGYSILE